MSLTPFLLWARMSVRRKNGNNELKVIVMLKKIFAIFLACITAAACASCSLGSGGDPSDASSGMSSTPEKKELTYFYSEMMNDDTVAVPISAPDQCLYYYDRLKNGEKDLTWAYNEIVYAASHLSNPNADFENVTEVYFKEELTEAELKSVYEAVFFDHPELWFLRQPDKKGCELHPESNKFAYLTYSENISDIPNITDRINSASETILKKVNKFTHDIDKLAFISAYIYDNYRISWPSYDDTQHSSLKEMLLDGYGVCVGFASTITYLVQKAGIPAISGHGRVSTGIEHCWTIVEHDGVYKYIDNYYMDEKGGGVEHSMSEFFCFADRKVYDNLYVTIAEGVLLPGTKIGENITQEPVPEDTTSSESDVSSEVTSEISE